MLLRNLKVYSFRLLPILLVFGCAKHAKTELKDVGAAATTQVPGVTAGTQTSSGTDKEKLAAANEKLEKHVNADACEAANSKRKKTLIEALSVEISPPEDRIVLSQGWLNTEKIEVTEDSEWVNRRRSWARSEKSYIDHKDNKSSRSRLDISLQASVKNLLWDDQLRVQASANYAISKDNVKELPALQERLETCFKNDSCANPEWSENELLTAKSIPLYDHFLNKLDAAKTLAEKRQVIIRLRGFMMIDALNRSLHQNSTVRVTRLGDLKVFNLPLDAKTLTDDDRSKLKEIAETTWKDKGHQVLINWVSRSEVKDAFRVIFHSEVGPRPYVFIPSKEIHLYSGMYAKAFAHQVGQALGLPETSYTLWNGEQCEYTDQLNVKDIMSFAPTGEVTEPTWSDLEKLYPEAEAK